jgi:hypothetical protein
MNIDYITAKENWKYFFDTWAMFNQVGNVLILYYQDKVVNAGWTDKNKVDWITKNVCPLIVVDKNVALNLTEQKYNELVTQLELKIKEFNLNKTLENIEKDFK